MIRSERALAGLSWTGNDHDSHGSQSDVQQWRYRSGQDLWELSSSVMVMIYTSHVDYQPGFRDTPVESRTST